MSDIAEILATNELDVYMMAQLKGLPKGDFIRIFGDHTKLTHEQYLPEVGKVTYRFQLEQEQPRVYRNHGYAPPIP